MTDDSVYNPETGAYIGEVYEAEDGARVLIDEHGVVLAAVDEDHNPLEPSDYVLEAEPEYIQPEPEYIQPEYQYQPEPAELDWVELQAQKDDLERQMGRTLTSSEALAAAANITRQLATGAHADMPAALEHAWDTGAATPVDLTRTDDMIDFATDIVQRGIDEDNGIELGDPPPRNAYEYDSSPESMTDKAMDALNGYDINDAYE